jgi:aminoglycoside phosphotransferase (APT) family kinase protein
MNLEELQPRLERWAEHEYGQRVAVDALETMPGHAGLSFGFKVVEPGGHVLEDLVLRVPPKGVRRRGNTDVLRQVPLLQAMRRCGVPVADVRHWGDDEQWFEVPYLMVERFANTSTFRVGDGNRSFAAGAITSVFEQAVDALALVHRVDWTQELADWEAPKALADEITFWEPILAKAAQPEWIGMGEEVRDLLLERLPADPVVGVFHGDYQTSNLLFRDGRLVAVIDWEIAGIGAQLLDVGWLLMMNDPESWADGDRLRSVPSFTRLVDRYAAALGTPLTLDDVAFYRALSGYRFGVISCLNVGLHRTGKRPDPEWERIAPSVPYLFGRAAELLRAS